MICDQFLDSFSISASSFGTAVAVATSAAAHLPVESENVPASLPYFQLLKLVFELLPAAILSVAPFRPSSFLTLLFLSQILSQLYSAGRA